MNFCEFPLLLPLNGGINNNNNYNTVGAPGGVILQFSTMWCIALRDARKETHKQVLWEQRLWVKQISYGVNLLENKYLGRLGCVAQGIETLQFLEAALGNFCPFPLLFPLGE